VPRKSYGAWRGRARGRTGIRAYAVEPGDQLVGAVRRSTEVASVSAGPPCGGLYLKPPSAGGLCDGVTTMPSASPPPSAGRVGARIACETAGVGV
jgi:hypothetical protein